MYTTVSTLKIGLRVEHKGSFYKIADHFTEQNTVKQYIIQSMTDDETKRVFRHEICDAKSQSDDEHFQIDEDIHVTQDPAAKKPRFKAPPSKAEIEKLALARTEPRTNQQTVWRVKHLRAILKNITVPPYNREMIIITDKSFMPSNHIITGMMKRRGKDITIHKRAVAEGDIQKLYSSGIFNTDIQASLQNKVFWGVVLNFGRKGQERLTDLKKKTSYAKYKYDKGQEYYEMT
ncbi:unnamed protein product [Mytilus coruscus]|uniref:Uncharacterized protein n=1 Tax=Mytilus coruscus TaxID=42192 RepID=A0A6J8DLA7_MYTCO|nr:unnamed protein product [Mytilus coruscus]